jgi:type IV pilus assembly protein PilO
MAFTGVNWRSALDSFFDKAQKVKKAHRLLIVIGLVLLLGGGFSWFVYMPRMNEIDRLEQEIADLKQKIALGKMWGQKLAGLQQEMEQVEKEFQKALKILPNEREIPSLLAGISQLGIDANLQFRLFSPGQEVMRNFYVEIPVSIEVGGTFRDVICFLDKLSRMERIVNIVDISLRPVAPLSVDLITSCKAVTYRFKSKEDEAKEKAAQKKK